MQVQNTPESGVPKKNTKQNKHRSGVPAAAQRSIHKTTEVIMQMQHSPISGSTVVSTEKKPATARASHKPITRKSTSTTGRISLGRTNAGRRPTDNIASCLAARAQALRAHKRLSACQAHTSRRNILALRGEQASKLGARSELTLRLRFVLADLIFPETAPGQSQHPKINFVQKKASIV